MNVPDGYRLIDDVPSWATVTPNNGSRYASRHGATHRVVAAYRPLKGLRRFYLTVCGRELGHGWGTYRLNNYDPNEAVTCSQCARREGSR